MNANVSMIEGRLNFELIHDSDEPRTQKAEMITNTFYVQGPQNWNLSEIHSDHLALSSLLVVRPWFNKSLRFSFAVSQRFADACAKMNIEIGPVDENLEPYDSQKGQFIALAYSGGADSTAALSVLPSSTIPIFLDRPDSISSLYSKDAALYACNKLSQLGYNCMTMSCNLETLRKPIGFPTDLANGVPAILMAKRLNLYGIAYGTVLESLYGLGRLKYKNYSETTHYSNWWNVFKAAGLPLSYPTGGISEVGTEIICSKSGIGLLAQSCIRGTAKTPCNFCWKCFRKQTLKSALGIEIHDIEQMRELMKSNEVRGKLSQLPISHENVLLYSFSKLDLTPYPKGFIQRFDVQEDLSYLEHWYAPSREFIDKRIRKETEKKIISLIGKSNSHDENNIQSWNNLPRINRLDPIEFY